MLITENLSHIHQRIALAATKSGRQLAEIQLIAVSKTRMPTEIEQAVSAGQYAFGENYLQEAVEKIHSLKSLPIIWHFIGPIQSNKTQQIATNFDWVHSVDRLKIAQRLSAQRPSDLANINVCVQVNISNDPNKSGVLPSQTLELLQQITTLPNIKVRGLMAIPAIDDPNAFARLQQLFHMCQSAIPELDTLSAGMSDDFETAIAHDATMIRLGTSIFGPRLAKKD